VSGKVAGWWMLDLAKATAGGKIYVIMHHLKKCF